MVARDKNESDTLVSRTSWWINKNIKATNTGVLLTVHYYNKNSAHPKTEDGQRLYRGSVKIS